MTNTTKEMLKEFELESEMLDIIYHSNEMTTSDLQGVCGAFIKKVLATK